MSIEEIRAVEEQIGSLITKLNQLRSAHRGETVRNYVFEDLNGEVSLRDLFGEREQLLVIHNMGQGCRYCTLWADGFNGLLPHLEDALSVVLVSKDPPAVQRSFANSRGWRFRLVSHGGGDYIREQTVMSGEDNCPGAVVYERAGDDIYRKNDCVFGPGDLYCSLWSLIGMAGFDASSWTPQYRYWRRPGKMDDGGQDVRD